jgi:hypothetical protein
MAYNDAGAFAAAIDGYDTRVESFESVTAGTLIASADIIGAFTFTYTFGNLPSGDPLNLGVSDGTIFGGSLPAPTTDGTQFLATNDSDLLLGGDDFTISFSESNAIGLWVISADQPGVDILDGDLVLEAAGITAELDIDVSEALPDGNFAYFLGIVDAAVGFRDAALNGTFAGAPTFVVDEITVGRPASTMPAPAMPFLVLAGLIGLAASRRSSAHAV